MKKTNAILFAAVLCTMASVCWGQSYWKKTYGGKAYAITPTPDGNFIVAGNTILKITPFGDTLWTKPFVGCAITPTSDGNFIIARGNLLIKITQNGDTLWTSSYFNGAIGLTIRPYAIIQTSEGNFIVAGNITENDFSGPRNSFIYLHKITSEGDTLWTKNYGGVAAYAITPTLDDNFIVAGIVNTYPPNSNKGDVYLLKITPNGDTLWTKTYGGIYIDCAFAITPTPDGNFIVAGNTQTISALSMGFNVYILKIKPNGDTLWTKTYTGNGDDYADAIIPTPEGNFIVVGGGYIFKIAANGDTLWTKAYEQTGTDYSVAITPTPDGNFIVAGNKETSGVLNSNFWLLSIINDRYAYKDSLFTFKIPVSGDSLNHVYAPLKVPTGMTVSPGGTISWTPQTDSVYMDHVEFLVSDDLGNKDSLTFNIFINSSYNSTAMKPLSHPILSKNQSFSIMQTSSSQIKFTLPAGVSSLDIFDIRGRCVQRIKPVGAQALWNGLNTAGRPISFGRYFAKIKEGKTSRMGQFTVVR